MTGALMRLLFSSVSQLVVLLGLVAACNSSPRGKQEGSNGANQANLVNAAKMAPMIVAGHTYRCEDNTVIRVDYLAGDKQALLTTPDNKLPIRLMAEKTGAELTFGGYLVVGRGTAITLQRPGSARQHCER